MKILCIGDSLTEGDYGSEPEGTANVHTENYPYFLAQDLGCEVINAGKCGYDASAYWNTMVKTISFAGVDIILIMLGTNGGLEEIKEDTAYTECAQYRRTNTKDYCKIITYCRQQTAGRAKIFLCTPPHVGKTRPKNRENVKKAYPVIFKVAEQYGLTVIDTAKESGLTAANEQEMQPIDGLHFGREGYRTLARFIAGKIIAENKQGERNIQ